jgi:hypothetical protein
MRLSKKAEFFMSGMNGAARKVLDLHHREAEAAARAATRKSRAMFTSGLSGRPLAPPRAGRPTTSGQFVSYINWTVARAAKGSVSTTVQFDLHKLDAAAPYWLIQEIGTGNTANITSGVAGRQVRYGGHVQSQVGRKISKYLMFAPGPGQRPTRSGGLTKGKHGSSGGTGTDQLYTASALDMSQTFHNSAHRIKREIRGKHYIQIGGAEGFRYFKSNVVTGTKRILSPR